MMKSKEDKADAERKKAAEGGFFGGKICLGLLEMRQIFLLFFFVEV
jgi:hypothetical protein